MKEGDIVNIERAMKLGDRLDGHIVQGHVDQTAICTNMLEQDGSWVYTFEYDEKLSNITIEKGSITVNGVSLTVVDSKINSFSVAIIPYTYNHTSFKELKVKGLIKMNNFKKSSNKIKYVYVLTPKGITLKIKLTINFMKNKMKEYDELKKEISD